MRIALCDDAYGRQWRDGGNRFAALASHLKQHGHDVVLLGADVRSPTLWLTGLARESDAAPLMASAHMAERLIGQTFDLCIFPEQNGLAHGALMARACGELPAKTAIVLWPEVYHAEKSKLYDWANKGLSPIVADALERVCASLKDELAPSALLIPLHETFSMRSAHETVDEIVFIGALTRESGAAAFIEAIEAIARQSDKKQYKITFIGPIASQPSGFDREWIGRRAQGWPFTFQVLETDTFAQAAAYLARPNWLAVVNDEGRRFTALLKERGLSDCAKRGLSCAESADPAALKIVLEAALSDREKSGIADPASPSDREPYDRDIGVLLEATESRQRPQPPLPLEDSFGLSFCILHFERPALLLQAFNSVIVQCGELAKIEIIIVDNASRTDAAKATLVQLEAMLNVTVIRLPVPAPYSSALNAAAEIARFSHLVFLDDDNLLAPGGLQRLERACATGAFDVLVSNLDLFEGDDASAASTGRLIFIGPAHTAGLFFNGFGDNCMAFHRESFLRLGGYLHRFAAYPSADWILLARAQAADLRIGVIQQPVFRYRRDTAKTTLHWQRYDKKIVQSLLLQNYGSHYDRDLLAGLSQALFLEFAG